jgi:hypothetical protein
VYPSSGSFYRAFACGATLLVCAASAQADGTPIPPGTLELNARNRWIVGGHTLDLAFPTREILNFHRVLIAIFGCKLPNVGQLLVKNPYIVLSQKEQDLARVRKEVQALLTAIPLLLADDQYSADNVSQELLLAISRNDLEPLARHLRNSSSQKR